MNKLKSSNKNKNLNNLKVNLNYKIGKKSDNLIKTHYYMNNYNNLYKINSNNSDFSSNKSNFFNNKNIMSNIKIYTKEGNNKKYIRNRTINDFGNSRKLYRSQSVFNIRNDINN